jgi:hypothetical protein
VTRYGLDMRTFLLALLVLASGGYLIPTLVANLRQHHNAWPIFWLNLFFGWTIIGWIIALSWACSEVQGS